MSFEVNTAFVQQYSTNVGLLLQHRITSYNVCYTKLLREQAGPMAGAMKDAAQANQLLTQQ